MLPEINLDNENYEEIFEELRKKISQVYPDWTDYNEHDPGITFLELFAWFKEMQQFHLNQIGEEQLNMYLKLLGITRMRKEPAKTLVKVGRIKKSYTMEKGTRMLAGDIIFETEKTENLQPVDVVECVSRVKEIEDEKEVITETRIGKDILQSGSRMRFFPFGQKPVDGNKFIVKLDNDLDVEKSHSIFLNIFDEYEVKRNPIGEGMDFYPLAEIKIEYLSVSGMRSVTLLNDSTYQMLESGMIEFSIDEPMAEVDGTYDIIFTLERSDYEVAPVIQKVAMNVVRVSQKETVIGYQDVKGNCGQDGIVRINLDSAIFDRGNMEYFMLEGDVWKRIDEERVIYQDGNVIRLYIGAKNESEVTIRVIGYETDEWKNAIFEMNGFPYQVIDLNDSEVYYDGFEIMCEDPVRKGVWEVWNKVENFHMSSPSDRDFCLDEETGKVYFGDCEHGLAPEGRAIIIHYSRTKGIRGNVKKEQIKTIDSSGKKFKVCNEDNASGGADTENLDECFRRFQSSRHEVKRAVTLEDYESVVYDVPGLRISKVNAVSSHMLKEQDGSAEENGVVIVVEPYSLDTQAKLNQAYVKNILRNVNKKRLVGTSVKVLSPSYIGIVIFAEIVVKPHFINAKQIIQDTIKNYFANEASRFGVVISEPELYGLLDSLECVTLVKNISISAQGNGITQKLNGDIELPVNGLAYIKQEDYIITTGDV